MEKKSASEPPSATNFLDGDWDSANARDAVKYSAETNTYRTSFESATDSLLMAIVSSVAAVEETEPMKLPTLSSVIDVDALEALIQPRTRHIAGSDRHVTFYFAGYAVTVHSYGIIALRPLDDSTTDTS